MNKKIGNPETKKYIISKKDIYAKRLDIEKSARIISLPIGLVYALLLSTPCFLPKDAMSEVVYLIIVVISLICSCCSIVIGTIGFIKAHRKIKNFKNLKINFYKRKLLKKPVCASVPDEFDDYVYEFEEFGEYKERTASLGFNENCVGDEYILICYENSKTILDIYSLNHYEIATNILEELL